MILNFLELQVELGSSVRVNSFDNGNIKITKYCIYITIMIFAFFPLHQWISVPFAMSNPAVSDITVSAKEVIYQSPWLGKIDSEDKWLWADNFCLLVSHIFFTIRSIK